MICISICDDRNLTIVGKRSPLYYVDPFSFLSMRVPTHARASHILSCIRLAEERILLNFNSAGSSLIGWLKDKNLLLPSLLTNRPF